jgi:hypothetical protein
VTDSYLERSARKAAAGPGGKDFHEVSAEDLERDVRAEVPLGSTRDFVEELLKQKRMKFSFDPATQSVAATAPYFKGSNFVVYRSLGFAFRFDDVSQLKSIDTNVKFTGP